MGGKTLRKGKFQEESRKRHEKGQQAVQEQSMMMEKNWVMMTDCN